MTDPPDGDPPRGDQGDWSYPAYSGVEPYGQHPPPDNGGIPAPESHGNPPARNGNRWWLALPLVVVIVLAGAGLWWGARSLSTHWAERAGPATMSNSRPDFAPGQNPSPSSAAQDCGPPPPPSAGSPVGWHQVGSRFGVGYDVPAEWAVRKCGVVVGWEQACAGGPFGHCTIQMMDAVAELEAPGCPDSIRTVTGLDGATDTSNLREAARAKALLVRRIYTSDDGHIPVVSLSDPKDVTVGGLPAVQIVANVTDVKPDSCTGPGAIHAVVAVAAPGRSNALVFVVSIEQGYAGAPDPALADRIVATLRPY